MSIAASRVARLAREMGWRPLDTGPLAGGHRPDLVWAAIPEEDDAAG